MNVMALTADSLNQQNKQLVLAPVDNKRDELLRVTLIFCGVN
jgi:hypothetical protein